MRRSYYFLLAILLLGVLNYSCNNSEDIDSSLEEVILKEKDDLLSAFGEELRVALESVEFRKFIKEEANKQFDYQYDIIYDLISETKHDTYFKSATTINKVSQLFEKDYTLENNDILERPIQISIPVGIDVWDAENEIPPVVILPSDFDEDKYETINAICADGSTIELSTKVEPEFPVILICEAERVDKDLKMRVDANGILVPKEERLSAHVVYNNSVFKSKNTNSLISVLEEEDIIELVNESKKHLKSSNKLSTNSSSYTVDFDDLIENPSIISAPGEDEIYLEYSAAGRIELDWPAITGADGYYIAMMSNQNNNWNYHYYSGSNAIFSGLNPSDEYSFQVYAVKGNYRSDNSPTQQKIVSGRNNNKKEYIDKIYIDKGYFRTLEFWGFQHIELDVDAAVVDEDGETSIITDDRTYFVIKDNDIQGKEYTSDLDLFNWNVDQIGQTYTLSFVEDDADGSADEVVLFVDQLARQYLPSVYKVQWDFFKGTFDCIYEIATRDEPIGSFKINWHDELYQTCQLNGYKFVVTMNHDAE